MQAAGVRRTGEELEAPLSAETLQGRRRRTGDPDAARERMRREVGGQARDERLGADAVLVAYQELHHARVGRIVEDPAEAHLLAGEAFVVLAQGGLDGVVVRMPGLDDDPAGPLSPAGAARHLDEQVVSAL